MDTRDRIIEAGLDLFSVRGYGSVTMGDIAEAVGIKTPSLYKHFQSKEELYEEIMDELNAVYRDKPFRIGFGDKGPAGAADVYNKMSGDLLSVIGVGLFVMFLDDPQISRYRRLLTMDQYRSPESASLLSEMYFDGPLEYTESVFGEMIKNGTLNDEDPRSLALEFYAPIQTLLGVCERQPEREDECLDMLDRHIRDFEARHRRGAPQAGSREKD